MRSGKQRRRTVRFQLTCLVLAFALPVWIAAGFVVYYLYQQKLALTERGVVDTTRALSAVVDQQFAAIQAAGTALAASPSIAAGDFASFYKQVQEVLQNNPGWGDVNLARADGQEVVNSYAPYGTPLPKRRVSDVMRRVFETGKPGITNLFQGALTGRRVFAVEIPVLVKGEVTYDLVFAVPAERLAAIFSQQRIPQEWTASILDANKVIVARNRFPERYVGRQPFPGPMKQMTEHLEGTFEAPGQEGVGVFVAFTRSSTTGWSVALAIPKALMMADLRRWLIWAVGAVVLFSTVLTSLALFLAHRIAGSIQALTVPVLALGRGEPVEIKPLDLAETNEVGQVLAEASRLQAEVMERRKAEAVLQRTNAMLEQSVAERTAELRAANEELTQFNRLMVDREGRMIELKEEINTLCEKAGEPARYAMNDAKEPV